MTDLNNRKLTLITVLVAVLVVAVIVQSVVIFGLHKQVEGASPTEQPNPVAVTQDDDDVQSGSLLPPIKPFDNDFFSWGKDEWNPFKEMHSMRDRINQMFGNAFNRFQDSEDFGSLFGTHSFSPSVNIKDKGDRYIVTVDLPGAEDSHIDINLDGQELTISGFVESEIRDEEDGKMLRQERRSGKFRRTLTLPSSVQVDKMTTKNKKGILYIEIPKVNEDS